MLSTRVLAREYRYSEYSTRIASNTHNLQYRTGNPLNQLSNKMSDPNTKTYELAADTVDDSCCDDTTPLRAFTLPDGRTIDGKNTLQSFDAFVSKKDVAAACLSMNPTTDNSLEK